MSDKWPHGETIVSDGVDVHYLWKTDNARWRKACKEVLEKMRALGLNEIAQPEVKDGEANICRKDYLV